MVIRKNEAIILRSRDYSESDRLITFFTKSNGRLTGIAKGARRSKKRFVHSLEQLSYVTIAYADRSTSGLVRIDASELRSAFTGLRGDLARLGYASLSCEMVLEISPERQSNSALFSLLLQYLHQLEQGADPENTSLLFQVRMLSLSGYAPNFQTCVFCGQEAYSGKNWYVSIAEGGLLCTAHPGIHGTYPLSVGTVMLLRRAQQTSLTKLWRLRFDRKSREGCRVFLLDLIRHHLEKDLKSLKLLRQIGALNAAG
ncbi:MAG: DNA repair protein RecO [Deltaproteobacteria bacterium]|nr:MAG: DNA repair protein RecO [Deltaproteobacteria bacterium]